MLSLTRLIPSFKDRSHCFTTELFTHYHTHRFVSAISVFVSSFLVTVFFCFCMVSSLWKSKLAYLSAFDRYHIVSYCQGPFTRRTDNRAYPCERPFGAMWTLFRWRVDDTPPSANPIKQLTPVRSRSFTVSVALCSDVAVNRKWMSHVRELTLKQWLKWGGRGPQPHLLSVCPPPTKFSALAAKNLAWPAIAWEPLFYLSFVIKISSQ